MQQGMQQAAGIQFISQPSIRLTQSGVIFQMIVTSNAAVNVAWFKGTEQLAVGDRYRSSVQENGSQYTIILEILNPLSEEDSATYRLNVKNTAGEANANFLLNLRALQMQAQQQQ